MKANVTCQRQSKLGTRRRHLQVSHIIDSIGLVLPLYIGTISVASNVEQQKIAFRPEHPAAKFAIAPNLQIASRPMGRYPLLAGQKSIPVIFKKGISSILQELARSEIVRCVVAEVWRMFLEHCALFRNFERYSVPQKVIFYENISALSQDSHCTQPSIYNLGMCYGGRLPA